MRKFSLNSENMESSILQEKIASLPEEIQQQLADYVDFLIERYLKANHPMSDTEKQALEKRYQHYQQNPSSVTDVEEVKNRLTKKYELPR